MIGDDCRDGCFASRLCGSLGIVAAVGLFLSPVPTCIRVLKERSTKSFSCLPYLAQTVESSWWALWAIAAGDRFEMLLNNVIGAGINFIYVVIFVMFAAKEARREIWSQCAFGAFLVAVGAVVAATVADPDLIFGFSAVTLNTIKYASPLSVARLVIVTQSVEFMPLPLTLASLCCGILWGLHGLFLEDPFIYVPNVAGVAFGCLQVVLYTRYGCCQAPHDDKPMTQAAEGVTEDADTAAAPPPPPASEIPLPDLEAGASKEQDRSVQVPVTETERRRSSKEKVEALVQAVQTAVQPADVDFPIIDQAQVAVFVGRHGSKQAPERMGSKQRPPAVK